MKFEKIAVGVISIGLLTAQLAFADGPTVSGFVDTTFNVKLQDDNGTATTTNFGRSFDGTANTFMLNTARLNFDGSAGVAGYHVALSFGTDQPTSAINNIKEAYITLKHMDNCWLTVGKFLTLEGIEVIDSGMNPTISRGYLFGLAEPAPHTGLKMDHQITKVVSLALGVVNGWGQSNPTDVDNNRDKTFLGKVGFDLGNPLKVRLVYYTGKEVAATTNRRTSLDITGVTKPWPGILDINFQYNSGEEEKSSAVTFGADAKWYGYGIQPVYTISQKFSIGARYEYFEDEGGTRGLGGKDAYNITLTPTWKASDAVTYRAEVRADQWTPTTVGASDKKATTVGGELIYTF